MTLRTPLYDLHRGRGARLVEFAGFDMPLHYELGMLKEHLHTRAGCGVFDVSHMGQLSLPAAQAAALEALLPSDIVELLAGRQRYTVFTNERGGVVDDLIVGRVDDDLRLVVNAACRSSDLEHLSGALGPSTVTPLDEYALIAVQGPRAAEILAPLVTDPLPARFMDIRRAQFGRVDIVIARSGYTGEDGFEISLPAESAEALVTSLEDHPDARLIGLGARDSLRLEAGLCLYGHELDETTTPIEAGLGWVIDGVRRRGGARAGGFPGADVIFEQMDTGVARRRVGLQPTGRAPIRAGAMLFDNDGTAVGRVTSGGFGASVGKAIAMGYVAESSALIGLRLFAEVRGRRHEVDVVRLPFVPLNYEY